MRTTAPKYQCIVAFSTDNYSDFSMKSCQSFKVNTRQVMLTNLSSSRHMQQTESFIRWIGACQSQTPTHGTLHYHPSLCSQTTIVTQTEQNCSKFTVIVMSNITNGAFSKSKVNKKAQLTLTNPRDSKGCKNCSNSTCFVSFHRIPFPQIANA